MNGMNTERNTQVTQAELEAAELIFNGASTKAVAAKLGVSDRMARFIIAGEKRPKIKRLVDEFVDEYHKREQTRIVRAHNVAFNSLMHAAAKATKFVRDGNGLREVPDYHARVKASQALCDQAADALMQCMAKLLDVLERAQGGMNGLLTNDRFAPSRQ